MGKISKTEIEEKVTDSIIAALEAGVAPWSKPWTTAEPTSLSTGRPYRGINWLILSVTAQVERYESPLWGTYKQISAMGGQVRKGETGTPITFWKKMKVEDRETGKEKDILFLRYYTVFNVEQADGVVLPPRFEKVGAAGTAVDVEEIGVLRDRIIDRWKETGTSMPAFIESPLDGRAYYSPEVDVIHLPADSQFESVAGWTSTFLHECAHSTGHESRLDRWTGKERRFGCADYAEEELTAEIGSAMLAARLGLRTEIDANAAYVASWLRALKDDRSMLITAAQRAQKAVDWIAGDYVDSTLADNLEEEMVAA